MPDNDFAAELSRANFDGTSVKGLGIIDRSSYANLVVHRAGGKLSWTSEPLGEDRLTERANLDGSARETVFVDNVDAFAFDPEGLGTPDLDEPDPDAEEQNLRLPLIRAE